MDRTDLQRREPDSSEGLRYRHTGDPHLPSVSVHIGADTQQLLPLWAVQGYRKQSKNPKNVFTDLEGWHRKAQFTKASKSTTARSHLTVIPVAISETMHFP